MAMLQIENVARIKNYEQHIFGNMMLVIFGVKCLVAQRSFELRGVMMNGHLPMLVFGVVTVVAYCRA
ncbi:hypothetical protein ACI514_11475 [Pseudomonas sp. M20]|jgi:hypothetical protein|uniref:hypothetical protein n=1 Tax=Pseudomonas sp. M20 TaxID=3379129 RepID=UPI003866B18F